MFVQLSGLVISTVLLEDGDVVEMPVVVAEQCVHLKEQRQIPGEVCEARAVRRGFRQVSDPPPVAGKPRQLVPQGHSQAAAQQVIQRDDGLALF